MKDLYHLTRIKMSPSTTYHPQTNGLTEWIDPKLNNISACSLTTNNLIGMTGFPAQNSHTTTKFKHPLAFLFINYSKHSYKGSNFCKEVKSQGAIEFAQDMLKIWEETEPALHLATEQMKKYYDRKCGD